MEALATRQRQAIAESTSIEELDLLGELNKLERKRAKTTEAINANVLTQLLIDRRIGELLRSMPKAKGGRPSETRSSVEQVSLSDIGIQRTRSHRCQKLAELPEEEIERFCEVSTSLGEVASYSGFMRAQRPPSGPKPEPTIAHWLNTLTAAVDKAVACCNATQRCILAAKLRDLATDLETEFEE